MSPQQKWEKPLLGELEWAADGKKVKYVILPRKAVQDEEGVSMFFEWLMEAWGLTVPKLCISVTGGAEDLVQMVPPKEFDPDEDLEAIPGKDETKLRKFKGVEKLKDPRKIEGSKDEKNWKEKGWTAKGWLEPKSGGDGVQSDELFNRLSLVLNRGVMRNAKEAGAWVISAGSRSGCTKMLGTGMLANNGGTGIGICLAAKMFSGKRDASGEFAGELADGFGKSGKPMENLLERLRSRDYKVNERGFAWATKTTKMYDLDLSTIAKGMPLNGSGLGVFPYMYRTGKWKGDVFVPSDDERVPKWKSIFNGGSPRNNHQLDKNITHWIFYPDSSSGPNGPGKCQWAEEVPFRLRFEQELSKKIPMVVLGIGGAEGTFENVLGAVRRKRNIIVVRSTGGRCDDIAMWIDRKNQWKINQETRANESVQSKSSRVAPGAEDEEFKYFEEKVEHAAEGAEAGGEPHKSGKKVHLLDPGMNEIINDGTLILYDPFKDNVDKVVQSINKCLRNSNKRDMDNNRDLDTLRQAWLRFLSYHYSALDQKTNARRLLYLSIGMNLLSTALAIVQTQLIVDGTIVATTSPGAEPNQLIYLSTIITPLLAGMIMNMRAKFNYDIKWLHLRVAAQRVKSEIYEYRARVNEYATVDSEVRVATSRGRTITDAMSEIDRSLTETEVQYLTLQVPTDYELMQELDKLKHIRPESLLTADSFLTDEDSIRLKSEKEDVKEDEMEDEVAIDPLDLHANQDNGTAQLTPDQYVLFRVLPEIAFYRSKLPAFFLQLRLYQMVIYILTGLSAMLAALGFQLWIPLTVQISTAANELLEARQLSKRLSHGNKALAMLNKNLLWWKSLSVVEKAAPMNVNQLVRSTEDALLAEVAGFVQSMESAKKKRGKKGDEGEEEEEEEDGGGGANRVAKTNAVNTDLVGAGDDRRFAKNAFQRI